MLFRYGQNIGLYPNIWRYIRSELRSTKQQTEVRIAYFDGSFPSKVEKQTIRGSRRSKILRYIQIFDVIAKYIVFYEEGCGWCFFKTSELSDFDKLYAYSNLVT